MSTEFLSASSSGVGPVILPPMVKFGYWRSLSMYRTGRWFTAHVVQPLGAMTEPRHKFLLKVINRGLSDHRHQQATDRLTRRVLLHDSLQHRGVPPVLDAELDRFPFFVVEPFVTGSLLSNLNYNSTIDSTISQRLWIARQLVEIINAAHHRGHAHLGLSPHKILVDHRGEVSILGWSNTHRLGERCWLPCEMLSDVMSRAPETFVGDYQAQPGADVYGLGTILYWLFTKSWPIDIAGTIGAASERRSAGFSNSWDDCLSQVIMKQQSQVPDEHLLASARVPDRLRRLILRMLAKNPLQRPTTDSVLDQLVSLEIDNLPPLDLVA